MDIKPYSRLVNLPIHSENIFHFPHGLPAFERTREFVFAFKPNTNPFVFMHALEPADLAFVCVDPFLISQQYSPRISDSDVNILRIEDPEDVLMLSICTVTPDMREMTANLQGPIVVNIRACLGKQILCEGSRYPVRHRIWDALNEIKAAERSKEAAVHV